MGVVGHWSYQTRNLESNSQRERSLFGGGWHPKFDYLPPLFYVYCLLFLLYDQTLQSCMCYVVNGKGIRNQCPIILRVRLLFYRVNT